MTTYQATETIVLPFVAGGFERLGRYQLLREIGRGAMSLVYEARDTQSRRIVALKVLHVPQTLTPDQATAMRTRFEREARAVAGLSHPNVVTIYELGQENGRHFLAMEFLNGETLRDRLDHGLMTPAQAAEILPQIASAVDAVHAQGVVHRDIKPSNVMLLPDGTAKLLDFGVARQNDDSTVTGTGALVGSPAYMSPEQVRGEQGTRASDIWALGALLYEMLAGHPPFQGGTIPAVLYQVTHVPPAPVVGVPSPVQRVLRRALQKRPMRRFPTATALADAFAAALPGAPRVRTLRPQAWRWAPLLLLPVALGFGLVRMTERARLAPTHAVPLLTHASSVPTQHSAAAPAPPDAPPTVHIYETTPPPVPPRRATLTARHPAHQHHSALFAPLSRPQDTASAAPIPKTSAKAAVAKTIHVPLKKMAAWPAPRRMTHLAIPRYLHRSVTSSDDETDAVPAAAPRHVFRGATGFWHRPDDFQPARHVFRGARGSWLGGSGNGDDYDQKAADKLNNYIYSPEGP